MAASTKKAPAKKASPKKTTSTMLPWVEASLHDALSKNDYWTVGQLCMNHCQYEKATLDGKARVAANRLSVLRSLAAMHVTAEIDAKYKKKRDALMADARATGKSSDEVMVALEKLRASTKRASKKALDAAGIPAA